MGREYNSVQLDTEAFQCGICLEFPEKPVECQSCDRLFCEDCLSKWRETGARHCPSHCRVPRYCRIGHSMDKILRSVPCACQHADCDVVKSISEIRAHEAECRWRQHQVSMDIDNSQPVADLEESLSFEEVRFRDTLNPGYAVPPTLYWPGDYAWPYEGFSIGAILVPCPTPRSRVESFRFN